jgi:hypothetical protein
MKSPSNLIPFEINPLSERPQRGSYTCSGMVNGAR